ncbi:MAG: hypothetical protein K6U89_05040 [Chloroflexi bacterium]|nr:hypothetical protein [Chloroflexota bacterium]
MMLDQASQECQRVLAELGAPDTGEEFPWGRHSLAEAPGGPSLVQQDGALGVGEDAASGEPRQPVGRGIERRWGERWLRDGSAA